MMISLSTFLTWYRVIIDKDVYELAISLHNYAETQSWQDNQGLVAIDSFTESLYFFAQYSII